MPTLTAVDHDPFSADSDPKTNTKETAQDGGFLPQWTRDLPRQMIQGATAGTADEILAGMGTAVKTPYDMYKKGTFNPLNTIPDRYNSEKTKEDALLAGARERQGALGSIAEVGGSLALPVGAVAKEASLGARMATGAKVGAGYGALYGAGEGSGLEDRVSKATAGALFGGALGAAAPPVIEGALQVGKAALNPAINAVRGAVNSDNEAARRVVGAISRDIQADSSAARRLTPNEFADSAKDGGPATILDIGGETTRALARSAANTSPEGRGLLTRTIEDRFSSQGQRVGSWLKSNFNYPNAHAQQEALETAAKAVNRPAYSKAYMDGSKAELWDEELQQLSQAPELQAAIRIATPQLKNWAVADGMPSPRGALEIVNGKTVLRKTANGNELMPNLQMWDYVKRALDQMGTPTAQAFSKALRGKLDSLVPSYAKARAGAAQFFGAENALEAGQNFVTATMQNTEAKAALAKMAPSERKLFQDGFVSKFIDSLGETRDRRNILNQIAHSPAARERLNMVLGSQKAAELEATLRVEGIIDLSRGSVTGNSTTARQLAELGFAGGAVGIGGHGVYDADPKELGFAAVAGALLAGKRGIDTRVAQRVAQMLVSKDPSILMRGVKLLSRNNQMMNSLRATDRRIAVMGGRGSPGSGVQSLNPAAAQGDQPDIQGPRGQ